MTTVQLSGSGLEPAEVVAVARGDAVVRLGARGRELMDASAAAVQRAFACRGGLARLFRTADVAAAMSVEALLGTDRAFDAALVALRPQPGQQLSAR